MTNHNKTIKEFRQRLRESDKSAATIEKYTRDASAFLAWLGERTLDKAAALAYREHLTETYAPRSVNAAISSLNSYFDHLGRHDCKIKTLRIQRQIFAQKDKELTRAEYERLLRAARRKSERLYHVLQTIYATGIRVSEDIYCKG